MHGNVELVDCDAKVTRTVKVHLTTAGDEDAIYGARATSVTVTICDMRTSDDFDLAVRAIQLARACLVPAQPGGASSGG